MKFASIIFLLAQSNTAAVARSALRAKPELEPALHVTVVTADANRPAVDGTTEGEELAADNPLVGINTTNDNKIITNDARNLRGQQRELVWSGGPGCPQSYTQKSYFPGELASYNGNVYQCASSPQNLFCGMTGFRPEVDYHWSSAWTNLGTCTPGISVSVPVSDTTSARSVPDEPRLGGCPGSWQHGIHITYKGGDRVSKDNKVFRCKGYPYSGHCSQQGYEPETNAATPGAWRDAWELIGFCEGIVRAITLMPTKSPTKSPICHTPTSPPTMAPPTKSPICHTKTPTPMPTTSLPTKSPICHTPPTQAPTGSPTTSLPTKSPTCHTPPTGSPTTSPTQMPTQSPTKSPVCHTAPPTIPPPTDSPTTSPTLSPTSPPTLSPVNSPTVSPTQMPTQSPTKSPHCANPPTSAPTF